MTAADAWLADPWLAIATLVILGGVFALFVSELYPPHAVSTMGVGALLALGALPVDAMLGVLSNAAPATIAALFILTGAMTRAGVLDAVSGWLRRRAVGRPATTIVVLVLGAMALSAFVNNTPVVIVLIPVTISLAASLGAAPSRFLIPLSYATILGGVCTLFGTSTNLLVDGVARANGLEGFGVFEMTPIGLAAAAGGAVYLALFGPWALPDRGPGPAQSGGGARFVIEALIGWDSPLVGRALSETPLFGDNGIRVVDILRGDASLRRDLRSVVLQEGDRLVLRTDAADLETLRRDRLVDLVGGDALEPVQSRKSALLEALVGPSSALVGRPLLRLRLRRRYGVYPIAAHRRGAGLQGRFETEPLQIGDTVLLEGAPEDLRRVVEDFRVVPLSEPPQRNFRPEKAPIVLGAILGLVALSALGVAPIAGLAVIAVGVILATRCLDADEAIESIDGGVLLLIYGMLAIGQALQETGAVALIVAALEPLLAALPMLALLAAVYAMASLLTELVSNSAVAVVATPIVIDLAASLGHDPRPFVLLVMIAASASFATPIGYQTNTLVYSAGGYRFTDFLRLGAPLNVLIGAITVSMIWRLYF